MSGTPHNHNVDADPEFYMLFIFCSDEAFTVLAAAGVDVYAEAPVVVDESGVSIGPLDATTWGPGKLNAITTRLLNATGIQLPAEITNGRRFAKWMLSMGLSRRIKDESGYRIT